MSGFVPSGRNIQIEGGEHIVQNTHMKILCINIDSDVESWRLSQQEFARVGLTVERLSATVGDNRPLAFNKSVYRAMEMCRPEPPFSFDCYGRPIFEYHDLLLFEDDVVFDRSFPEITSIQAPWGSSLMIEQDNGEYHCVKNYMTLHLGANIIGMDTTVWQMPTPYSNHLARLWNCWQSHATLYSAECVKYILDNFKYVTDEYKTEGCQIFDEWLRLNVLPMGRSYVMNPMIAYQRPRASAIWGGCWTDYTSCHKRGNQILAQL